MDLSRCRITLKQVLRKRTATLPRIPRLSLRPPRMPGRTMSFLNFDSEPAFDTSEFLTTPEEPMLFDFDYTPGYDFAAEDVKPFVRPSQMYEYADYSPDSFHGSDRLYDDAMNNINTSGSSWSPIPSPSSSSSPIAIPSGPQSPSFFAFSGDHSALANPFSPTALAAALPLPSSHSPSSSSFEENYYLPRQQDQPPSLSVSPHDTQTPAWATQLWDSPSPGPSSPPSPPSLGARYGMHSRTPSSPRSSARHSPLGLIPRERRNSGHLFPSSSAPGSGLAMSSMSSGQGMNTIRAYSRRAESFGAAPPASAAPSTEEREATVRARRRSSTRAEEPEFEQDLGTRDTSPPLKSVLRPPKLAPSAWQLYFTDWIQRQQASSTRKLNVAQAAKEAGQEYASLSEEEKEPYKRRSQAAKDVRERQLASYMRTLTPDDIKRENAFRAAQRKAGKSRKSNIKDPNAPKKPLSAYFMFLQRIRADKRLVEEVFGEETETTRQSVLAAARWRAMSDEERKPFLAQAEQEKMEYEAARRVYEDGASPSTSASTSHAMAGMGGNFNFSILPGVGVGFPAIKIESSESEGEGDVRFLPPSTARS
ncbi:putative HMG1 protein [Mycena albidolilacea]|uniref:HMG1 protein n=1 Tax=Mycena albidolilacea TaxID=1033008 RepID=A0AAD7F711_9AGAR|nr:putative HMG1 protein [Mycena albidolilacea]